MLKRCEGDPTSQEGSLSLPLKTIVQGPLLQPTVVVKFRQVLRNGKAVIQTLIQWEGRQAEDNSWEEWEWIKAHFPDLEDKVVINERGDVTNGKKAGETLARSAEKSNTGHVRGRSFTTSAKDYETHVRRRPLGTSVKSVSISQHDDEAKVGGRGKRMKWRSEQLREFVTDAHMAR